MNGAVEKQHVRSGAVMPHNGPIQALAHKGLLHGLHERGDEDGLRDQRLWEEALRRTGNRGRAESREVTL